MGYSARRGFTNGKISGAARQAELQQKIAAMQEKMTAAQDAVEAQEFTVLWKPRSTARRKSSP